MNPYYPLLIIIPVIFSILAGISNQLKYRLAFITLATITFWVILLFFVNYAYAHPFNPSDGGPKTFALAFGWIIGLIIVILPTFGITLLIRLIHKKINKI